MANKTTAKIVLCHDRASSDAPTMHFEGRDEPGGYIKSYRIRHNNSRLMQVLTMLGDAGCDFEGLLLSFFEAGFREGQQDPERKIHFVNS